MVNQYQTTECLVFVRFGKVDAEHLVYAFNFKSSRQDVLVVADGFGNKILVVVLILDLSDNLLQKVLKRDYSRCAAEFVDYHGK